MAEIRSGSLRNPSSGEAITMDKIYATVVLDIIGSTLEPIHKGRNDFLIMLSGGQFTFDLTARTKGRDSDSTSPRTTTEARASRKCSTEGSATRRSSRRTG